MITEELFEEVMNTLGAFFDKEIHQSALSIWLEYFNEELTDEDLVAAVKQVLTDYKPHPSYFPSAKEIVGLVKGSREVQGMNEWQKVLRRAAGLAEGLYLDARAHVALQAIGGIRVVERAEERQREALEKKFLTVYVQCPDKDARMLPQAQAQSVSEQKDEHESVPMPDYVREQLRQLMNKKVM